MSGQFARLRGALDRVGTTTPGTIVGVFAEDLTAIMNHYVEVVREAAELKAARAQPAQAGALLTDADIDMCFGGLMPSGNGKSRYDIARQIEQAVRSKLGAGVPMTDAQMRAAFAMAHPQDHADMQDGSPANAVERIGARNVYRRFERGIRAAERHHGIVGKEGGNVAS